MITGIISQRIFGSADRNDLLNTLSGKLRAICGRMLRTGNLLINTSRLKFECALVA